MSIAEKDKFIIRDLAKKVAEIASLPVHKEKRDMWIRLNRLERVRPLIHVQAIDPSIWVELIPDDQLQTTDAFCRSQEMELRKKIYCWENFPDDRVVDDVVVCPIIIRGDSRSTGFGMKVDMERPEMKFGAGLFKNTIEKESDIDKIQTNPQVWVDWEQTERNYERLCELYDGTLQVEKRGPDFFWLTVMDQFIRWRGIQQMFVDLIERPKWVHEALERITTGHLNSIRQIEKLGLLSLSNGNTRLGSGGYGWTDLLPQTDFDGEHVRLRDLWARCSTQIFTEGISPEMHDEFAIQYEKRLLEPFGLSAYGCCEPLHNKMRFIRKIKNLRRVSMSPWVDIEVASTEVGRDYVYTHKPNPTIVSMESWHPELAEAELRDAFEKTRENIVEVNLQDLHTVRNEPHRLTEWTQIALQLAEKYA
ncbi:TPA: hypothetical protein EYP66_12075 [Candidatus Poribacteria bacterium]|nr:hypothetical protein [Candidatus Poribacteria bacterium]